MNAFDRFLIFRTLSLSLGATVIFTVTLVFSQSQRLVEAVTNSGMPIGTFIKTLLTLAPFMADGVLVAGTAVGLLFVMLEGRQSRELLVGQTLGLSPWRRFMPFALAAFVLAVFQLLLSMVITPPTLRLHHALRNDFSQQIDVGKALTPGFINRLTPDMSIYVEQRIDGKNFRGLRIYNESILGHEQTSFANRVAFYESDRRLSVLMIEGMQIFEGEKGGIPRVTTFSVLPISFGRHDKGLEESRVSSVASQNSAQEARGQTRGSAQGSVLEEANSQRTVVRSSALDIGKLTPSEVPAAMALQGALFVWRNWSKSLDFSQQPIRVPSNEFHRRISAALSIGSVVLMIFVFLTADFYLRRPPVMSYIQIAVAVSLTLLLPRFFTEMGARYFLAMYLAAALPIFFVLARKLFHRGL